MNRLTSFALLTSAALMVASPAFAQKVLTEKDVEAIVIKVIKEKPEMIVESLQTMQNKLQAQQGEEQQKAVKANYKALTQNALSPIAGNAKGDVIIAQFYDFHCGYCKRMLPVVQELIGSDKNVKIIFIDFPILSEDSVVAAKASVAANRIAPKKYMEYHSALMNYAGKYDEATVIKLAKDIGIDGDKLAKEMSSDTVKKYLAEMKALGEKMGVRGTPAMVIGQQMYPGALDVEAVKQAVAKARSGK